MVKIHRLYAGITIIKLELKWKTKKHAEERKKGGKPINNIHQHR